MQMLTTYTKELIGITHARFGREKQKKTIFGYTDILLLLVMNIIIAIRKDTLAL